MSRSDAPRPRIDRCPYCGSRRGVVHVHAHGQCASCGTNIEPCCTGASAASEAGLPGAAATAVDPELFPRLFAELGGTAATVTSECVLNALARALDVPLDEARTVLDAGIALGHLQAHGAALSLARPAP